MQIIYTYNTDLRARARAHTYTHTDLTNNKTPQKTPKAKQNNNCNNNLKKEKRNIRKESQLDCFERTGKKNSAFLSSGTVN